MSNDTAQKKTYGLLGKGISYSLSPVMHNAAFGLFRIAAEYTIFDVQENRLDAFFRDEVLTAKISGFNVTVPYKIRIKEALEKCHERRIDISEEADVLGAVNTVKVGAESILAANTDARGFYESLIKDAGFNPKNRDVFIAGAGGAGRAISWYLALLADRKPHSIHVYDIDEDKVEYITSISDSSYPRGAYSPIIYKSPLERARECDLVINATPLGTKKGDPMPVPAEYLKKGAAIYDLVYARETEFVRYGRANGLTAVNGLGMLVNQAAMSFEIWTGISWKKVRGAMGKAALEEMEKRGKV